MDKLHGTRNPREALSEFRCIQWVLAGAPDKDVTLEASRMIPHILELDYVWELSHNQFAMNHLLSTFLKSLTTTPMQTNTLFVYSSAIGHILMSLPPTSRLVFCRAFDSVFRELHFLAGSNGEKVLHLLVYILSAGYGFGSSDASSWYPSSDANATTYLEQVIFHSESDWKALLPLVYLALSFGSGTQERTTRLVKMYSSKLSPAQAVFLRIWFLTDGHTKRLSTVSSEHFKNRWNAYTW